MLYVKKRKLAIALCGLAAVLLVSCKISPPTSSDYDDTFDFTKLKTYSWIETKEEDKDKVSTLESRRQINAIESILKQKGFERVVGDARTADFLLRTHTLTDKKLDVDEFYGSWGYYPYGHYGYSIHHSGYGYGYGGGGYRRALGVYKDRTPEERASITMKNATYLLASFPPRP